MHHTLRAFTITTIALGALACGGSTTEPTSAARIALQQAESQWNAAAIHDYNYDLVTSFAAAQDSVQVQVRGDKVTLSTSYVTGQPSSAGETVQGLFDAVDAAIASGLKVDVIYNPQVGYPASGSVSQQYNTPAGPSSWEMVHFTRVP